jgi:hypothetical protein
MRAIVIAGLNGIAPRDEMEGMIAAQMLACHDAAMGCFREALNSKLYERLAHPRAPLPGLAGTPRVAARSAVIMFHHAWNDEGTLDLDDATNAVFFLGAKVVSDVLVKVLEPPRRDFGRPSSAGAAQKEK